LRGYIVLAGDLRIGLHHHRRKGRHDGNVLIQQQLDSFVIHRATVFDHIYAELGDPLDAVVVGGVGGDGQAVTVGLIDDGL